MTLTRDSVLHYWDARFGVMPRIGGKPVHSRNSSATWVDELGAVQTAIVNTPRMEWADLGDGAKRRNAMRLEQSRTNLLTAPNDLTNGAWGGVNCTATLGFPDPTGGNGATRLTATAGTGHYRIQSLGGGTSILRTSSIWVRRITGFGNVVLYAPDNVNAVVCAVTDKWQKFSMVTPAASATRTFEIDLTTVTDQIDVWGANIQEAGSPSATIPSLATRAADSFYWDFTPLPQAMFLYWRFVQRFAGAAPGDPVISAISDATGAATPRLVLYYSSAAQDYKFYHDGVESGFSSGVPAYGNTLEAVGKLDPTGAVTLIQSLNGGAAAAAIPSAAHALAGAWAAPRLYLNSQGSANVALSDHAEVKAFRYADVVGITAADIMAELRAFELDARGEVL
jgi:hypothetical protein